MSYAIIVCEKKGIHPRILWITKREQKNTRAGYINLAPNIIGLGYRYHLFNFC